jgi:electron transfer flavoprotein beta subunit
MMKVLVAVKRVIDPYVKIRVRADGKGVETQNIKHAMNPFDEIAVEEAVRLLEKNIATDVLAVSIGTDACQETLRHAMALGLTRGHLIQTDKTHCSLNIAKILHCIIEDEKPDLVLMGKQAIDDDNNQCAQMLAALLNWPQVTFASALTVDGNVYTVERETDSGSETLMLNGPAVISVDLRLNEPRYASLPNIMKAKQKPLVCTPLQTLNLDLKDHVEILSVTPPSTRSGGVKVDSVEQLIDKLRHEAKVL